MNHLPFIAASYAIFAVATLYLAIETAWRLRATTKRLKALDHRKAAA
jgi:heme exporter protein CcmD